MALSLTVSSECTGGAGYAHLTGINGPGTSYRLTLTRLADSQVVEDSTITRAGLQRDFDGLYDSRYRLTLTDENDASNTGSVEFNMACGYPNPTPGPGALQLDSVSHTNETGAGLHDGTATIQASGGNAPLTAAIPALSLSQPASSGQPVTFPGLAPGAYDVQVGDSSNPVQTVLATVTIAPATVRGCTDPEADNYDPTATVDNGSCVFSPHLALAPLPELAPVGVPLWVTLSAVAIPHATPALASATFELAGLGAVAGVQVRVDGYLFTAGPLIVPGRFTDAASLYEALAATPALAAAYSLTQAGSTVTLTATVPGLPGAPQASTSDASRVSLATTAGAPALWSQRRAEWGCYLEVWAGCGTVFGGPVDKASATLAQRLPMAYRADNSYRFDIASALGGRTGHAYPQADGSCPDRLVSYFLRFGEEYADATGRRRVRTTYESAVAWGLEAMEVPAEAGGLRLLSARPGPWAVQAGGLVPACLLGKPAADVRTLLRYRLATARATVDVLPGHLIATGQVTQGGDKLLVPAGALSGELRVSDTTSTTGPLLASLVFVAGGQALTFVNRQGGTDTVLFFGNQDENSKRTASTYTNAAGPQGLAAELALASRLSSGLLDLPAWNWLRRELGTSPAAWLDLPTGPLPVLLADLATEADTIKGEYSLSVDLTLAPVRGLSN